MKALVGYTGFVGSNIYSRAGKEIDAVYNSKNIEEAFGTDPDLLIYAGLRAEKYLANNAPDKDMDLIRQAESNISKINPRKLVLISTIDVFPDPVGVCEKDPVNTEGLHAYGLNRYRLEEWVRENCPDALIIRLPGLFGRNIKKNFIYDLINLIPSMLKEDKFKELAERDSELPLYYSKQDNGFYRAEVKPEDREKLKEKFRRLKFSALNFTDSRSVYQFYNLSGLWDDIRKALDNDIKLWHPATEPVSAAEIYRYLTGEEFVNELSGRPAFYDYRTVYDRIFGGDNGYICTKEEILREIKAFTDNGKGR